MSEFDTMDYIICAAVLCYGIYPTIQNVCLFLANEKVRKGYLSKHEDDYTIVNQYLPYMIFLLGFSVIGIIGIFVMERSTKDELYACFALALVVIISTDMTLDSIVKWRVIVGDNGFVYEKAHYRFRSVLSMDPTKSIIKNVDTLTAECRHVVVSERVGVYPHKCFLAWKRYKKNKDK